MLFDIIFHRFAIQGNLIGFSISNATPGTAKCR
jgi:hypothetical protein